MVLTVLHVPSLLDNGVQGFGFRNEETVEGGTGGSGLIVEGHLKPLILVLTVLHVPSYEQGTPVWGMRYGVCGMGTVLHMPSLLDNGSNDAHGSDS